MIQLSGMQPDDVNPALGQSSVFDDRNEWLVEVNATAKFSPIAQLWRAIGSPGVPFAPAAIGFVAGILADRSWPMPVWTVLIATLLIGMGAGFVTIRYTCTAAMLVLGLAAGMLHHAASERVLPADHIRWLAESDDSSDRIVILRTTSVPITTGTDKTYHYYAAYRPRTWVYAQAVAVIDADGQTQPCRGTVRVTRLGGHQDLPVGTLISATGRLTLQRPFLSWPGILNDRQYAGNSNNTAILWASHLEVLTGSQSPITLGEWFAMKLLRFRAWGYSLLVPDAIESPTDDRGVMAAMVLGQRDAIDRSINDAFLATGSSHVLTVSGFHLGILTGAAWWFAGMMAFSRRTTVIFVLAVIGCYVALNEPQSPLMRSAIAASLGVLALAARQPAAPMNWMAMSAIVILFFSPTELLSVGFQLSYVSLLGIAALSGPIQRFLQPMEMFPPTEHRWSWLTSKAWQWLSTLLAVSFAAWLATLPLVVEHFQRVSVMGPWAALVLLPLGGALVIGGFIQMVIVAMVGHPLGMQWVTDFLSMVIHTAVTALASVPGAAIAMPRMGLAVWAVYLVGLLWMARVRPEPTEPEELLPMAIQPVWRRWLDPGPTRVLMLLAAAMWLTQWVAASGSSSARLIVGQRGEGQAVAVVDGSSMVLVDAGADRPMAISTMVDQLAAKHLARLRAVVLTTPDQAYFCDVAQVLSGRIDSAPVVASASFGAMASLYPPAKDVVAGGSLREMSAGDAVDCGHVRIRWLYPSREQISQAMAEHAGDLAGRRPKLDRIVQEMGSAVWVAVGDGSGGAVVAPTLGVQAWRVVLASWPSVRAETLVVNGVAADGGLLTEAIRRWGVRRLVVAGGRAGEMEAVGQRLGIEVVRVTGRCREFEFGAGKAKDSGGNVR